MVDNSFYSRLWAAIWGAVTGGFFGLLVSLLVNVFLPRFRRWNLTRTISIVTDPSHHNHIRLCVVNGGYWTINDAILYLSLDIQELDTLTPPAGLGAHIYPGQFVPLRDGQLCWSVRWPTPNPLKVPILSGEFQPFSPCRIQPDSIVIPTEEGWSKPMVRVLLQRRRYTGTLKLVSADTTPRCFSVVIDPDSKSGPFVIKPIKRPKLKLD